MYCCSTSRFAIPDAVKVGYANFRRKVFLKWMLLDSPLITNPKLFPSLHKVISSVFGMMAALLSGARIKKRQNILRTLYKGDT